MIITVFLALLPRVKATATKLKGAMKRWAERSRMSEEELFLDSATDYSDLKNRMRIIEERRRHANGYSLGARRYY